MAKATAADAVLNIEDQIVAWAGSDTHWHGIESERAASLPGNYMVGAGSVKATSNWLELTMRYVVDPKKRRPASSFIYTEVFKRVSKADDILITSETMDLTVHRPKAA